MSGLCLVEACTILAASKRPTAAYERPASTNNAPQNPRRPVGVADTQRCGYRDRAPALDFQEYPEIAVEREISALSMEDCQYKLAILQEMRQNEEW